LEADGRIAHHQQAGCNTAAALHTSFLDKGKQIGIEDLCIHGQHAMREAGVGLERAVLQ
jgi:hypothetical protein